MALGRPTRRSLFRPMSRCGTFRIRLAVRLESVVRTKAEVERHHDMDRVGNLLRCIDPRCGDFELMIVSDSNQEFAYVKTHHE